MSLFEKGRAKTGGRRKGVKDRIGTMFLEELAKDFEEHGPEAIKIARIERPVEYLKIIAATLPREFEITDSRLEDISDNELDALIELARQQRAIIVSSERREDSAPDREPVAVLPALREQKRFHDAGAKYRERCNLSGNQLGKTLAGGFEAAMHATGRYPDWWQGKRFDGPTVGWASGVTGETVRDTIQRILVGRSGAIGTGAIPKDAIGELVTARGIADLLDTIKVRHVSGGTSIIGLKSYLSGREKFQGETLHWVWYDEEPPIEIYTEGLTRTNVGNGPVWMTATPLLGMSEVVRRFLQQRSADRFVIQMQIDDVDHFSAEEKARIIASYPPHEVEARTKGIPILGSGRIFPIEESRIAIEHRDIPAHWPRIGGMDFGWEHPFAAVQLAWDRDTDTVYVTKTHRLKEATPVIHAGALRSWGKELRWAWPRDGRRETLEGAGIALAEQYKDQDLNMLHEHAQFEDGSVSVEAGLMKMLTMMQSGRFKVFKHLNDWWEEFRLYHRKDGKVVKEGDDLMSATRYGIMMLRYAQTAKAYDSFRREIKYPRLGIV